MNKDPFKYTEIEILKEIKRPFKRNRNGKMLKLKNLRI